MRATFKCRKINGAVKTRGAKFAIQLVLYFNFLLHLLFCFKIRFAMGEIYTWLHLFLLFFSLKSAFTSSSSNKEEQTTFSNFNRKLQSGAIIATAQISFLPRFYGLKITIPHKIHSSNFSCRVHHSRLINYLFSKMVPLFAVVIARSHG